MCELPEIRPPELEFQRSKEICREPGISDAAFYNWKAKSGGMEASGVTRMMELAKQNAELKKMFAEMSLEKQAIIVNTTSLPQLLNPIHRCLK